MLRLVFVAWGEGDAIAFFLLWKRGVGGGQGADFKMCNVAVSSAWSTGNGINTILETASPMLQYFSVLECLAVMR